MRTLPTLVFTLAGILCHTYGQTWQNEKNCGISFTDRIVGGRMAAKGKYPWLVEIGFKTNGQFILFCGGTLISRTFVLTASHCFQERIDDIMIRLGETELTCQNSPCEDPNIQEIKVKKLFLHDEFSTKTGYADIALLQLENPARLNKWVKTICLSGEIQANIGDEGITAGWGFEDSYTRETPSGLKELTMEIVPGSKCAEHFSKLDFESNNYICAGGKQGEDTCGGDSGGPFMRIVNLGDVPRMYLIGDLSFGSRHCGEGVPSIFTPVVNHLNWIIENVNSAQT